MGGGVGGRGTRPGKVNIATKGLGLQKIYTRTTVVERATTAVSSYILAALDLGQLQNYERYKQNHSFCFFNRAGPEQNKQSFSAFD